MKACRNFARQVVISHSNTPAALRFMESAQYDLLTDENRDLGPSRLRRIGWRTLPAAVLGLFALLTLAKVSRQPLSEPVTGSTQVAQPHVTDLDASVQSKKAPQLPEGTAPYSRSTVSLPSSASNASKLLPVVMFHGAAESEREFVQAALSAATAAAEAATAALAEIKQTKASGLVSKPEDLELTGKPEEDRRIWQDWKFAAIQYLSARDQKFVENINEVTRRTTPVAMEALAPDVKARSESLYAFLSGLVKGRLLGILKNPLLAQNSNGFEAMRLIQKEIEPASGAAAIGLLETILSIPEPPKGTPLRDSILAIERLFEDILQSRLLKLGENLKIATLRKLLPPELKVHATDNHFLPWCILVHFFRVTEYEVADRSFQALKPEAIYSGAIPMEVDAVQMKGKGKGPKGPKPVQALRQEPPWGVLGQRPARPEG
eukprot:s292_g20.t1